MCAKIEKIMIECNSHGGYRFREKNEAGERVLNFASMYELAIGNTFLENEKIII